MITSTPKKAISSEANLIHCLICAESLETTDRIAVFGRSQWDLRGTISKILGGELQPTNKDSQYRCKKKCFPKLKKVEKLTTTLKTLEDELRANVWGKAIIRIKRGRSEEVSAVPSLEDTNNVKSIKTTLLHSNVEENLTTFPPPSSVTGCEVARHFVPIVMRAFPNCVNNMSNNQTLLKSKTLENPCVQVSGLLLFLYRNSYSLFFDP